MNTGKSGVLSLAGARTGPYLEAGFAESSKIESSESLSCLAITSLSK